MRNTVAVLLLAYTLQPLAADTLGEAERAYRDLIRRVEPVRLGDAVRALASAERIGGPTGACADRLKGPDGLGVLGSVGEETFLITVPNPKATGTVEVGGKRVTVYPLWPNGVRTSTCEVKGPLIYAGDGQIERFDGQKVKGAIVIMEFNSGQRWRNAARLGANGVIFLEPETTQRGESETKWSSLPLSCPRFYLRRSQAGPLLAALGQTARVSCQQEWLDRRVSNMFATLRGSDPEMRNEWVVISAYADSISVVPGLPHGADQASGAAALLELARAFKAQGTKRSVLFLLTSGHFQAMQGIREFIERRFQEGWAVTGGKTPLAVFSLDLSSRHFGVAAMGRGWWFDYRNENVETEEGIARTLRERMPGIAKVMRITEKDLFADAVNSPDGRHWKNYVPGRFAVEAEIVNVSGLNGLTFLTSEDARDLQDTPFDTTERVDIGNLATQTRLLCCLLHHLFNDSQDESAGELSVPYRGGGKLKRMALMGGYGTVSGRVLRYDPRRSFLPDVPMPGALVVTENQYRSYLGVRGLQIARARGRDARYTFIGVPPVTTWYPHARRFTELWAYVLDDDGRITHSLDFGPQGSQFWTLFMMTTSHRETPAIVFPCVPIEFYGLTDPHLLRALPFHVVLDARNNGEPRQFSIQSPFPWLPSQQRFQSFIEDSAIVYALAGTRIKFLSWISYGDPRLALTNGSDDSPEGVGIAIEPPTPRQIEGRQVSGTSPVFQNVPLETARDMWTLNQSRLDRLGRHRIIDRGVEQLQASARREIREAERALADLRYSDADRHARAAWGFGLRAHPQLRATARDILHGLIFYLALLLPFSYFSERLLLGAGGFSRQLLGSSLIFVISFLCLRALHPGFELTGNTLMIFVSFVMGALSLIVITFVVGKFETGLHKLQQLAEGVHEERVGKIGVALSSLSIGLSNMRRRRVRTALTCATLVIVTFIVLSFTSIVPELRFNEVSAEGVPRYNGILLRNISLEPLEENSFRALQTEFGNSASIGRRPWFYGSEIGTQSVLALRREDRLFEAGALLGLDPQEAAIARPQEALLPGGRWFKEGEMHAAILPASVAERLKIRPEDVGRAVISFGGSELKVVGIADDAKLKAIHDLDNQSIMPADFALSRQLQEQGRGGEFAFREYVRIDPSTVCIVPAETAISMGAEIRTVAVAFQTLEQTNGAMRGIMPRIGLNLYAAVPTARGAEIRRFSTVAATKSRGLEYIIIPVLIAAIMVLNTMISSVFERTREIGIFSAVGLSPKNIGALFFAESLVYAILGAVSGYFLAQIAAKGLLAIGAFPDINLNYSSLSAVSATLVVVGVVLLSTVYPARKAAQIATPAGGEEWQAEPPTSDHWVIPLPFTVTRSHAAALSGFYSEWLEGYKEYSIGEFVTEDVRASGTDGVGVETYFASARAWLAPYDLGVQQDLTLLFRQADLPDVYAISLEIDRISGDPEHWESLNRRFLRSLRRQFLIWRTLAPEKKQAYLSNA